MSSSEKEASTKSQAPRKLRAFAGNSFEDYHSTGMADHPIFAKLWMGLVMYVIGFISKVLVFWKVENGELLWNDKRGRVLVMNHVSAIDPVITVVSGWFHGVTIRPVYKSEFDANDLFRWFWSRVGAIPINRGTADMSAVRKCKAALERGECVLIYPEGTRVRDDEPHEIHGGFALIAQLADVPVQPLAIVGARNIKPEGAKFPRPFQSVYIRVGECVSFSELGEGKRKELCRRMEKTAWDRVLELRDAARADHPGRL